MNEVNRIHELLRDMYEGRPWHGSSLKKILSGVTAREAAARGVASAHTIWEIVLHIEAWMEISRLRLGGKVVGVGKKRDWPDVGETTEASWKKALADLDAAFRRLMDAVSAMRPGELEKKIPKKGHTAYKMLHGVIDHNVYHSAQISVLRKEIASRA